MVFVTGDCHGDFGKLSPYIFEESKALTRDDFVIICGDFGGIWMDCKEERANLQWLERLPFTVLFVDGNHENFDRLYSEEFKTVDFHGGKAHKIRKNVYHLLRGYIFDLCGKKFFCFGGAKSHDCDDGILNLEDYRDVSALVADYKQRTGLGQLIRINHTSWWKEELPSEEEINRGRETLKENGNKVDYIITHCAPDSLAKELCYYDYESDVLTEFFEEIKKNINFTYWLFGHYHGDEEIDNKYELLYNSIVRLV